jgi:hypothetical protein
MYGRLKAFISTLKYFNVAAWLSFNGQRILLNCNNQIKNNAKHIFICNKIIYGCLYLCFNCM